MSTQKNARKYIKALETIKDLYEISADIEGHMDVLSGSFHKNQDIGSWIDCLNSQLRFWQTRLHSMETLMEFYKKEYKKKDFNKG